MLITTYALQQQHCHFSMVIQVAGCALNTSFSGRLPVSLSQFRSSMGHHVEDDADVLVDHSPIPQAFDLELERVIDWLSFFNFGSRHFVLAVAAIVRPQVPPQGEPVQTALGLDSTVGVMQLPDPRHFLPDKVLEVGLRQLRECLGR